ncbi:hypothetical protein E3G52_000394 [Mycobacteroides abscessus]|uniref:DUF932 domain-containing protein n=1 Tax=Mycobacteroides abscessus TaxID=36809 RepID=UPI001878FA61|nr:DUF932 domain-containing protein [Mycobacteroides abscessus]MBE5453530.1 hypothetical protein [Mycobacteroides abscessus]
MTAVALPAVPARTLRNANVQDLMTLLEQQHRQKVDVVMPVSDVRFAAGDLVIADQAPDINTEGVTDFNGTYRMTDRSDSQLGDTLEIPTRYVRKLRAQHTELLDTNVNELARVASPGKKVLVRMLSGSDPMYPGTHGIVRAVLSDRYGIRDNLDTVLALLDGMRSAGLGAQHIRGADLSDERLYLRVTAPELEVVAPKLLEGYRSPWAGTAHGGEAANTLPVVYAGMLVTNSETGGGALTITPELRIKICDNGLVINADSMRKIHLGRKLDDGKVTWSADTIDAANDLIKKQVRDAVASYMTVDYVKGAIEKLEETSSTPLTDPAKVIEVVAKKLSFSQDESRGILDHFIKGGQMTAGGVMQAVTSYAQLVEDVDRSNEFAATGVDAMLVAAGRQ